jgi:CHAD domain-containing protein
MPYRLQADEPVAACARRIAVAQVAAALEELDPARLDRDEGVHRARRRVKRVRALLRLVRPALGEAYSTENARFRDAARLLASSRDAAVAVQTVDALLARYQGAAGYRLLGPVRLELILRHRACVARSRADRVDDFRIALARAGESAGQWRFHAGGFAAIAGGLRATYARGRRAMRAAYRRPDDERFHEWRQQVRYHELHCELLRGVWRPVVKARSAEAHRLAEILGAEHDLAVLAGLVVPDPRAFGGDASVSVLLRLIKLRRAELKAVARPLGRKLYAERPAALEARFKRYWKAHRAEEGDPLVLAAQWTISRTSEPSDAGRPLESPEPAPIGPALAGHHLN